MGKPPSEFMGLQHIALKVHDIKAGIDFYVNKLGFTVSEIYPPGTVEGFPFGLCFMRCTNLHHDVNLIFWPEGEIDAPEGNSFEAARAGMHHLALRLASKKDFGAWEAYLQEEGIEVIYGPVVHSPTHPDGDGLFEGCATRPLIKNFGFVKPEGGDFVQSEYFKGYAETDTDGTVTFFEWTEVSTFKNTVPGFN